MRLDIKYPGVDSGDYILKVLNGADKVRFWIAPTKEDSLSPIANTIDQYLIEFDGTSDKTLYIEATDHSETTKDIEIEASYYNITDAVRATAFWVDKDSVHLSTPTMQQVVTSLATYTGNYLADLSCLISNTPPLSPLVVIDQPTFYDVINCKRIANNSTRYGFGSSHRAGLSAQSLPECPNDGYPGDSSFLYPDKKIGAKILWEFKIRPSVISGFYTHYGISFDVTRQKSVNTSELKSGEGIFIPSAESPVYFPWLDSLNLTDNERANDDSGDKLQNDNTPNADNEIYSFDPPGIDMYEICYDGLAFKVFRASFKEFVRIKLDGDFVTNINADSVNILEGSRASDKEDWYTVFHARRSSTGLYKMALDTDSASVSIPVKVSSTSDNGTIMLNVTNPSIVTTNGYRLTYTADSTGTWNVARMIGGMPVTDLDITADPNDEKKWNAMFEGVTIAITENDDMEFEDGDSYTYSTFKTQNPNGKVNGIGLGLPPFNILSTPY